MARISQDEFSAKTDTSDQNNIEINALGQDTIEVPSNEFIANSTITRDGQDLNLESPQGETLVIQNYFSGQDAPLLESPDGSILTPSLVNSFLSSSPEYAQAASMTDESPVGAVEEINGEATVTRTDGTSETLTLGTPIFQGDVIETSEAGAVNIMFIDETSMAVSNNARMAIDEYQFDPSTESGETNLSVLRGVFVFTSGLIGRDDPDDVLIDTPVGSIGIRGTVIAGNINPGGESEITVIEGAIVVTNSKTEVTLSEQFESVKIYGYNTEMQDIGVKDAENVGDTYGSVSDVVPKLFSSINDNMKQSQEMQNNAQEENIVIDEEVIETLNADDALTQSDTELQPDQIQNELPTEPVLDPALEINDNLVAEENLIDEALLQDNMFQEGILDPVNNQLLEPSFEIKDPIVNRTTSNNTNNFNTTTTLDTTNPNIFVDRPLVLNAGSNLLFEGKGAGDVVGRFFTDGGAIGPKSFSFGNGITTTTDGTLTLVQVAPNVVEIRLTGPAPNVGNSLGTNFTIIASDAAGQQTAISMAPLTVMDAAVNLNTAGGIFYPFISSGALTADEMIGDVNGDGQRDFIRTNGSNVEIIDGSNSSSLWSNAGTSISEIGDINNDGYADVIAGDGAATNGLYKIVEGGSISVSTFPGSNNGDMLGQSVIGLGDFNSDGISDYAIGAPGVGGGNGAVYLELSNAPSVTIASASTEGRGAYLDNLGDVNGDGLTDLLVGTLNGNNAYIVYGGTSGVGATINTGQSIVSAGSAGDFNGDGFDDFAVSLDDGTNTNTYIVYSNNGLPGNINMAYLENPDHALKLHDAGTTGTNYEITAMGDIDGDGFDDVHIGSASNGYYTIYGDRGGSNTPYVMDNAPNDNDTTFGIIEASANGQALVGDADFNDAGFSQLKMQGGGSNNVFTVNGLSNNIDGGAGYDTIEFISGSSTLDFTAINFEKISQIEHIDLVDNTSSITLTTENIFNFLKSSDDGTLTISGTSGGTLNIDAPTVSGGTITNVVSALNETGVGASHVGATGGYEHYSIGGYDLYIDQGLTTAVV